MTLAVPLKTKISGNSVIRKRNGAGGNTERVRANGQMWLGAAVTYAGETSGDPDVGLAAVGERIDGIIIGTADVATDLDKDSDDKYDDNTWLLMYKPISGDELWVTAKTNSAITYGLYVRADGGYFIAYAYTDGAENTDLLKGLAGTCQETVAAAASTEKVFLLKWGL